MVQKLGQVMVHQPEWRFHPYMADEVSIASRKEVGIQAADLVAREAMKHLDNQIGPKQRLTRGSLRALEKTKRFGFISTLKKSTCVGPSGRES